MTNSKYETTDLEQPLISTSTKEDSTAPIIVILEEDPIAKPNNGRVLTSWPFLNGFWLGFIIQTVSLGSTAVIAIHWGEPDSWVSKQDEFYYAVFFILSQSWWILFPLICIAIEGGLTGNGKGIFEKYCFSSKQSGMVPYSSRDIFLGGVRFHVGIVFGCFLVWTLIDLYFGASLNVFLALFSSLIACLSLCYGMIIIHDRLAIVDEEEPSSV